jgi:hypothetical protein
VRAGAGGTTTTSFHLELPDSKLDHSDSRVVACFEEYAKLTRKDGKSKNDKFEKRSGTKYANMCEYAWRRAIVPKRPLSTINSNP